MLTFSRRIAAMLFCLISLAGVGQGCTPNEARRESLFPQFSVVIANSAQESLGGRGVGGSVQAYVSSVGQEIARNMNAGDTTWEFVVIDSKDVDHYSVPLTRTTARVFITRGLLDVLTNEAQLASALAFEVASITTTAPARASAFPPVIDFENLGGSKAEKAARAGSGGYLAQHILFLIKSARDEASAKAYQQTGNSQNYQLNAQVHEQMQRAAVASYLNFAGQTINNGASRQGNRGTKSYVADLDIRPMSPDLIAKLDARAIEAISKSKYKASEYRRFLSTISDQSANRSHSLITLDAVSTNRIDQAQRAAEGYPGGTEGVQEYRNGTNRGVMGT